MMRNYVHFSDETRIAYSDLREDGTVLIAIERPREGGFDLARCVLPTCQWREDDGFDAQELKGYELFLKSNASLILALAGRAHAASSTDCASCGGAVGQEGRRAQGPSSTTEHANADSKNEDKKTSQDYLQGFIHFDGLAGHFALKFFFSLYDVNRLREELDAVDFRASCSCRSYEGEDLSRAQKAGLLKSSMDFMPKTDYVFTSLSILVAAVSALATAGTMKMNSPIFSSVTTIITWVLIGMLALILLRGFWGSMNRRFYEALSIIEAEGKVHESEGKTLE